MTSSSPDMALVKVPEKTIQGLVPEHPALSAAQAALGAQLRETQRRLHDELREAITAAKAGHMEEDVLDRSSIPNPVVVLQAASRARQDQGVQLYEVQEQVAGLQASLSRLQASAAQAAQERSREEVALQQAEAELASAKRAHAERDGGTAALRAALAATEVARRSAAGDAQRAQHEAGLARSLGSAARREGAAATARLARARLACVDLRARLDVLEAAARSGEAARDSVRGARDEVRRRLAALVAELESTAGPRRRLRAECARALKLAARREVATGRAALVARNVCRRGREAVAEAEEAEAEARALEATSRMRESALRILAKRTRDLGDRGAASRAAAVAAEAEAAVLAEDVRACDARLCVLKAELRRAEAAQEGARRAAQAAMVVRTERGEDPPGAPGATLELAAARRELAGLRRACVEARREIGVHAARAARASARQEGPVHREAAELEGRLGAQARGLQRQDDRHSILQAQLLAGRRAEAACRRALHALEAQKATALEGLRAGPGGRIDGLRDTLAELVAGAEEARRASAAGRLADRANQAQWLRAAREEGRLAGRRATTKQRKSLLASRLAQLEGRLEEARACAARHGADLERLLAAAGASDARLAAVGASVSAALGMLLADQREREEALRAVRDEVGRLGERLAAQRLRAQALAAAGRDAELALAAARAELAGRAGPSTEPGGAQEAPLAALGRQRTALRAQVAQEARRGERLALELERTIARRAVAQASQLQTVQNQSADTLRRTLAELARGAKQAQREARALEAAAPGHRERAERARRAAALARGRCAGLRSACAELAGENGDVAFQFRVAVLWTAAAQRGCSGTTPRGWTEAGARLEAVCDRLHALCGCMDGLLAGIGQSTPGLVTAHALIRLALTGQRWRPSDPECVDANDGTCSRPAAGQAPSAGEHHRPAGPSAGPEEVSPSLA
ncbi:hypothetical protein ACKKBF_B16040 [Auxenochlorella protothecoides x Auxenochlorella symbiontica]